MPKKSVNFSTFMISKYKKMKLKSLVILFFSLCISKALFAFDATFMLNKDAFVYDKYNFSIVKVIDARIDKQKPIGIYYNGLLSNKKQTVGNDSINKELERHFLKYPKSFYEPTKIILVINQINLIEILNKRIDDLELTLAFDYYRVNENTAKLEYSQYLKYDKGAGTFKPDDINKLFSSAVAAAFLQFKNQIMYYKPLEFTALHTEELEKKLNSKIIRRIDSANANDGLYFNIHQLIKNAPVVTSNYKIVSDSALLNNQAVAVDSKTYLVKKVFAFVKNSQLYIYMGEGIYLPAIIEGDGKIMLKDVYYKEKEKKFNNPFITGLKVFVPVLAIISDINDLSKNREEVKVYIDEETGQLKI
ncbi:MAG: hypothetical protein H0W73_13860 [Bacteroidetes bacterium]|nr:hypothetical protein [Bacteroidota bacterium]